MTLRVVSEMGLRLFVLERHDGIHLILECRLARLGLYLSLDPDLKQKDRKPLVELTTKPHFSVTTSLT